MKYACLVLMGICSISTAFALQNSSRILWGSEDGDPGKAREFYRMLDNIPGVINEKDFEDYLSTRSVDGLRCSSADSCQYKLHNRWQALEPQIARGFYDFLQENARLPERFSFAYIYCKKEEGTRKASGYFCNLEFYSDARLELRRTKTPTP